MLIATIVGARPQFVKAAPVSAALASAGIEERLVHTGQHYDRTMSEVFFEELGIPPPHVNLGVGSGPHGRQTGEMLAAIEGVLVRERPDRLLVYGDTNSTLAGAVAAAKLGIPVAHVEAGLRSFNRAMPEEHNRIVADRLADLLFCPSARARDLLAAEGIRVGVHVTGDVMVDAVRLFGGRATERSDVLDRLGLAAGRYVLATVHRPYNTDDPARLAGILAALSGLEGPVVLPVHPRTRARLGSAAAAGCGGGAVGGRLRLIEPVGYLDMLALEQHARLIVTDSGGVQKEAFILAVPCVTIRPETEWTETVESGWNTLAGHDPAAIADACRRARRPGCPPPPVFGDGHASERIAAILKGGDGERGTGPV